MSATTIPSIDCKIQRIQISLAGPQDLILQITDAGAYWSTELFQSTVPKELQCLFVGPDAAQAAITAYNLYIAKQPKDVPL